MRNDMLFIGDKLMDLDDDTKVTLNFKSNIFTDLSKIISNNSYTIKLPNTIRNRCAIMHADLPSCDIVYPRIKLNARYFRNGIEILNNATAVLLSTSDVFEFALSWGNVSRFANIISGNKTLRDLKDRHNYEVIADGDFLDYHVFWKVGSFEGDASGNFFIPKVDYGIRREDTTGWYHPGCKVTWILLQIMKDNGVTFTFPANRAFMLSRLFVPLLTRNDSRSYAAKNALHAEFSYYVHGRLDKGEPEKLYFADKSFSSYYGTITKFKSSSGKIYIQGFKLNAPNMKILMNGNVSFDVSTSIYPNGACLVAYYIMDDDTRVDIATIDYSKIERHNTNSYTIYFDFTDIETDTLEESKEILFGLLDAGWIDDGGISMDNSFSITAICDQVMPSIDGEINAGYGHFPIIANLPEIKQIDFIKAVAAILGVFAVPGKNDSNSIEFVSVDTIKENETRAYDWTKKVVATYRENKPNMLEYRLNDFAQLNYLRYKEDSTVNGSYDGALQVLDYTLDSERDILTLPFAGTDMAGGVASIKLYKYDSDGKSSLEKVEPRILLCTDDADVLKGTFEELDFSSVINSYYKSYSEVIYMPKVITEKIEINDIELRDLDMTVPIYLAQYGRYYAIISIKAEDTGICECKLLQLEV